MKKAGLLSILGLIVIINVYTQENNYLINDIANLIGLDSNMAISRMEDILKETFQMDYEIIVSDEIITFKKRLNTSALTGMEFNKYLLTPNIILTKNTDDIIISVTSENIIIFDITKLDYFNSLDERIKAQAENIINGFKIYSRGMIENDKIFNLFINNNIRNIPVRLEDLEINYATEERSVQYIWIGNNELYEYIGRTDIGRIEYGFVFDEAYLRTFTKWYIIN